MVPLLSAGCLCESLVRVTLPNRSVSMTGCFCWSVFLSVPVGEDEDEFENFMLPLTIAFESVTQMFNSSFEQAAAKVGLFQL